MNCRWSLWLLVISLFALLAFSCTVAHSAPKLHKAAIIGDLAEVRSLIKQGADVNEKDTKGCTPLYFATLKGHEEIVELLKKAMADR